ncbi:MAG: TldD/PmbA family protein [Deltaproteobacteria bacterium]|nr:TldD/PmbA family protein [Deltaproteobacteria bacterium]
MADELSRSKRELVLHGHEAPYYVAAAARGTDIDEVAARYGAITADNHRADRRLQVEVRVGSYEFDNTGNAEVYDFDAADSAYAAPRDAAIDDDPRALKNAIWLQADEQYKRALSAYLKKKGKEIYRPDDPERPASFSREPPQVSIATPIVAPFDHEAWKAELRAQSERIVQQADIFDSLLRVSVERHRSLFASTEGARLVQESVLYGVTLQAWARAPDGMLLEQSRSIYAATEAGLPKGKALAGVVDQLVDELLALRKAPVLDPYTGPALLLPEAAGVLFHEAVGHRLEGERQNDDKDGHTFKGQVGKAILPTFLSISDDPTRAQWNGEPLNGVYDFDEQGVAAQRAQLVKDGVLQGFLLSRAPVAGFPRSNGHGRAQPGRDPQARMANLIVESSKAVPFETLKGMLQAEAKKQGKPFGLIIRDVAGGNTDTSGYAYQAFKGQPRLVYKLDAQTGEATLVRGVEVVGTPLTVIGKIVATGDDARVFNGFCGAESGYVPVSTVAPSVLVTEMELQRTRKDSGRPPLLPSPLAPAAVKK